MGVDLLDLPQPPGASELAGEGEVRQVSPLGARLKHGAAAPHRVAVDECLGDILCAGLLTVDVLARLGGEHRHQAVPVGTGGDQHRVDVLAVEHLAEVAVHRAVVGAVLRVGNLLDGLAATLFHVGDGGEGHIGLLEKTAEVVFTAAADADAADDDPLARWHRPVEAEGRGGNDRGHRDGRSGRQASLKGPPSRQCIPRSLHENVS